MDSKLEKEEFVSGLEGTTITEIYLITVTLCVGYLLRCCALICFPFIRRKASSSVMVSFLLEYSTTVFPAVLIFTVLADYTTYVLFLELFITGVMISSIYSSSKILSSIKSALSSPFPPRLPFLTLTRTYINLFTAVAILGVDFKIYPRRLAKAELYGAGLMDVGVGSFLMAHGLTSPEAREQGPNIRGNPQRGYFGLIGLTVRHVLPLLVLGFVRLLAVKTLGYQEHVTEYGVHWNFFFTIATVRVRGGFFPLSSSPPPPPPPPHIKYQSSSFEEHFLCNDTISGSLFTSSSTTCLSPIWLWCDSCSCEHPLPSFTAVG